MRESARDPDNAELWKGLRRAEVVSWTPSAILLSASGRSLLTT